MACEFCKMYNCPSGCPNAPQPIPVYYCADCKGEIYDGDTYYKIEGKRYCADCIDDCRCIAEAEEFDDWEDA